MTSKKDRFYVQRVAKPEEQVAKLIKVNAELAEQVAKLTDKGDKCFGQDLLIQFKRLFHIWHLRDKIPKNRYDRIVTLAEQQDLPPKSTTLAKQFRKHGEAMFRFLFDPSVPPTNNAAEQTLRQAIIDRRITQGSPVH
ncbi:hypothetical protein LCGC14_1827550 [marine sediment metagenome]|uniref:Transposase IS66 central domain-containing protein n=1 Tax=marine sediment metagenome TaxID=412755 RepID=A0A0F9H570_9ZZZZ